MLRDGNGNDRLKGKCGNDAFLFRGKFGNDLIVDYDEGEVLILKGYGLRFQSWPSPRPTRARLPGSKVAAASSSRTPSTSARTASS